MIVAALYSIPALRQAFGSEYVVQDDARQYLFWMERFLDPTLFPHDLIADYFQSVVPYGYETLYRLMAGVGIHPLFLSKLLPAALGLFTTAYTFGVCMQMLPVPAAGFIASSILNQHLWSSSDLVSATPRAFLYPLFLAFLYYFLRRSLFPCAVAIALQGLFYPQFVFVSVGILILVLLRWEGGGLHLSQDRSAYLFCATSLAVALLVMLIYALKSSQFGPVITGTEARILPEYLRGGRASFFTDDPWRFWLTGKRSGILHEPLKTPLLWTGVLLPILLRYPSRFPLAQQVSLGAKPLLQIIAASLGMFFAAHALLFRLHLPSRYTTHSLPIVMALAAGIALTVLLDAVFLWKGEQATTGLDGRQFLALGSTALLGMVLVLYPGFSLLTGRQFSDFQYIVGKMPPLYEFFSRQPKDILIASLENEANNLPTFSKRSILVGNEYSIPYHVGYYRQIHQRATDLIRAQYSQDLAEVRYLIQTYGVDFLLVKRTAFTPQYVATDDWIRQFQPAAEEALARLKRGIIPALAKVIERCYILETKDLIVLQAECIENTPQE